MELKTPRWSIMIPTYNCAKYLKDTLNSVIEQDQGIERMQIEVIDDCSTHDNPEKVVNEFGNNRIGFYRKPNNEGATANFNTCIQRARGELVHILHGDDLVENGFYKKIESVFDKNNLINAVFCRSKIIDQDGKQIGVSNKIEPVDKLFNNPGELYYQNQIYTPSVVIKKQFYEKYGGFKKDLVHIADWEMWLRVIREGNAFFIEDELAVYRSFEGNETSRLVKSGENITNTIKIAEINDKIDKSFSRKRFFEILIKIALNQIYQLNNLNDKDSVKNNFRALQAVFSKISYVERYKEILKNKEDPTVRRIGNRIKLLFPKYFEF